MAEPHTATVVLSTAAATVAAGAASQPLVAPVVELLPQLGLHWPSAVAGLLGVIIVQTLMPTPDLTAKRLFWIAVGSSLFASVGTSIAAPIALKALSVVPGIDPVPARAAVSAFVGGFARYVLQWIKGKVAQKAANESAETKGGQ